MNAATRRVALPLLTVILLLLVALPLVARHAAAATDRGNDGIGVEDRGVPYQASADSDGDGATDAKEAAAGSDPTVKDTDGDGLSDGEEIGPGEPRPSPIDPDSDDDGLADGVEAHEYGTQPVLADTDGYGVKDRNEVAAGTDPLDPASHPGNGAVDTDGDGLTDAQEVQYGTDLDRADTDGDGTNDGDEVAAGTDPTDPASAPGGGPGPGDLLVRAFACPPGYTGYDYAGQCEAKAEVAFSAGPAGGEGTGAAVTGADGTALFDDLGVGAFVVAANLPGANLARVDILCVAPGATEPRTIQRNDLTSVTVDVRAGERLTCSFYISPAAAQPSAAPSSSAKPSTRPTTLPNTGAGTVATASRTATLTLGLALGAGALLALTGTAVAVRRRS